MNLLIVEDDPNVKQILREMAELRGAKRVFTAASLDLAVRILNQQDVDAVLSDGSFPTNYGAKSEVFGVRENWPHLAGICDHRKMRFAVLTGSQETAERVKRSGHEAFLKPMGLSAAIDWLLGLRQPNLEDPRVTNGRRHGCLKPAVGDSTGEPYGNEG